MIIQRRVWISGLVQGVGFRAATIREAARHPSVRGFCRNLSDGRVEAVFVGEDPQVLACLAWCSKGPSLSRVVEIEVREETPDLVLCSSHAFVVLPDVS